MRTNSRIGILLGLLIVYKLFQLFLLFQLNSPYQYPDDFWVHLSLIEYYYLEFSNINVSEPSSFSYTNHGFHIFLGFLSFLLNIEPIKIIILYALLQNVIFILLLYKIFTKYTSPYLSLVFVYLYCLIPAAGDIPTILFPIPQNFEFILLFLFFLNNYNYNNTLEIENTDYSYNRRTKKIKYIFIGFTLCFMSSLTHITSLFLFVWAYPIFGKKGMIQKFSDTIVIYSGIFLPIFLPNTYSRSVTQNLENINKIFPSISSGSNELVLLILLSFFWYFSWKIVLMNNIEIPKLISYGIIIIQIIILILFASGLISTSLQESFPSLIFLIKLGFYPIIFAMLTVNKIHQKLSNNKIKSRLLDDIQFTYSNLILFPFFILLFFFDEGIRFLYLLLILYPLGYVNIYQQINCEPKICFGKTQNKRFRLSVLAILVILVFSFSLVQIHLVSTMGWPSESYNNIDSYLTEHQIGESEVLVLEKFTYDFFYANSVHFQYSQISAASLVTLEFLNTTKYETGTNYILITWDSDQQEAPVNAYLMEIFDTEKPLNGENLFRLYEL